MKYLFCLLLIGCAAELDPVCILEGNYYITYNPAPGCGAWMRMPPKPMQYTEVECDSPIQHCEPGFPSERCEFDYPFGDGSECSINVVWELVK